MSKLRRMTGALLAFACVLGPDARSDDDTIELTPALLPAATPRLTPQWSACYAFEQLGEQALDVSEAATPAEPEHHARNCGAETIASGVRGKAIRLQRGDYLAVPGFSGGRGFTVAAWVRTRPAPHAQYIVSKGNNYAGSFYLRLQKNGCARVGFLPIDNFNGVVVEDSQPLTNGKWRHVAGVMDGERLALYVDGKPVGQLPFHMDATVTLPTYERLTWIGAFDIPEDDGEPNASFFAGDLDEVRLLDGAVSYDTIARWATPK